MTLRRSTVALVSLLWIVPALAQAQAPQADAPAGASVLQVQDQPDQIIRVNTRIRHTTVIQLPAAETILDFIVGDSEYWHLTGAANLAFLKPIGEGVNTNVALVCESGRIYSFLVVERDAPPHLIVRVGADPDTTTAAGAAVPAFVARSRVAEYQLMAEQSREAVQAAQRDAEARITAMRQDASAQVEAFSRDLSHALGVSLSAGRQGAPLAVSWCTACGTTGNLRTSDLPPRKRPRSTRTATASRPSSRTTSSKTASLSSAGSSVPAGCKSAANARAGKSTSTIWNNHHAELDPTERPGSGRIFSNVDHADRRDRVRPDSRRRIPGAIVLFDSPHRPGLTHRGRGDRRRSRHRATRRARARH